MSLQPLAHAVPSPLRQQVVDILRDAITNGFFEPGGRLTERALCESLGVSRSTVREALRQLEAEGLVRITPNKGPMVAELSQAEAREIYDIRAKLQALAAEACARQPAAELVATLESALGKMEAARHGDDFPALQTARTDFYNVLFDGSGNRQLAVLLKQLRARMTLMRGLDGLRERRMEEAVRGASDILEAVRRGDAEKAGAAVQSHIERAAVLVFEAVQRSAQDAKAAGDGGGSD